MLPTPLLTESGCGTRSESDHVGVCIQVSHKTLSPSVKFAGQFLRGMCGFLGVRETSALSLIIFLCKAEEFGRRDREGERRGHVAESNSVPVVKALHSLLVIPL